ncbi:MAG: signal peptidase II [bacterium]|nr:signal peptidase II [bacterium]
MKKSFSLIMIFSFIFLFIDQLLIFYFCENFILNESVILIKNFFSITLVHNTGAAFSILKNSRIFLIIIGVVSLFGILFYIIRLKKINNFDIFVFSLLIGGLLGNLIDRIFRCYVIDYLSFNFGNYYFPIFNFADVCIVVSIILMIINVLKEDLWK